MTSFVKPEINNISLIEPRLLIGNMQKLGKIERVVSEICSRTVRYTDRQQRFRSYDLKRYINVIIIIIIIITQDYSSQYRFRCRVRTITTKR